MTHNDEQGACNKTTTILQVFARQTFYLFKIWNKLNIGSLSCFQYEKQGTHGKHDDLDIGQFLDVRIWLFLAETFNEIPNFYSYKWGL